MHNPVIVTPKNNLPYFFYKKIKFLHFGRNLEFPTPPTTILDHCAVSHPLFECDKVNFLK